MKLAGKVKDILGDESFDSNGYIELDTLVCFHANIGHNTTHATTVNNVFLRLIGCSLSLLMLMHG